MNACRLSCLKQVLLVALSLAWMAGVVHAQPMIVKDGQAVATIVISEQPQRSTKVAAKELQTFLKAMTGAELPIATKPGEGDSATIFVGASVYTEKLGVAAEGFSADGFRNVTKGNALILLGQDDNYVPVEPYAHDHTDVQRVMNEWDQLTGRTWSNPMLSIHRMYSPALDMWDLDGRGSINAVVHFLRSQGVRWYFPSELGQVIPKVKDIALPQVDETVNPDYAVRHMFIYYAEFFSARTPGPSTDEVRWNLWLGLRNKSSNDEWGFSGGHGLVAATARPEVREKHPEYYALWAGKRAFDTARYGAQCLSSQGLRQEIIDYGRTMFDHYDAPMVNTGPGDSYLALCQCELCQGKATPERGWGGQLSDYVWGNTDAIARELYKTHPDKWVSNISYSTYQLPPTNIKEFTPNVAITLCKTRALFQDDETRKKDFYNLVDQWLAKLPSKRAYLWEYYLQGRPGSKYEGLPVYFPRIAAQDLSYLNGKIRGEYIEVYGDRVDPKRPWHELATMHLNCYVTARLWWDADLDIDALLDEFYTLYYGPAAPQMKDFIEYSEANWRKAADDAQLIDGMFQRLEKAQAAAAQGSVERQRIDMVAAYIDRMHQLRDRLAKGRENNPAIRAIGRNSYEPSSITIDGKLDDTFWQGVPVHSLSKLVTGGQPEYPTTFQIAWREDALYLAIHCTDVPGRKLKAAGQSLDDTTLWNGDAVEILLETQVRSYYQIAISPTGAVVDLDRTSGFGLGWTSNAVVATQVNSDGWTAEVKLPIVAEIQADVDPLNGIAGRKPHPTYPWFFNICRQRRGEHGSENSAFSPTGSASFHVPLKFAELIVP